ncbi:uncharacterized protein LOC9640190 [Selaginella moellendorffii]|uniref:uncharacterized protein LOC9640190 n=1 Tax=Selaginella moellendorffii TaxID=88036 RepID=UPI000D1C3629|nr:uncharacterized protein LOC9640190 [Selaginella moellendorffii]|eukprot:XP_024532401.1 uncharacterized protein LOC9640190 [Selaginella moellendorffii]
MDDKLLPSSSSRRMVSFKGATQVHVTTLDEVVSVNSFFTIAVFLGLSFSSTKAADLETDCPVGPDAVKYLLLYEVLAFASFLFSSLVAHGLKLYIIFANSNLIEESQAAEINNRLLRIGMLASAIGSVAGTIFLMLSMISLIELRLGPFSCDSSWTERTGIPFIVLSSSGLLIFISSVLFAFIEL